MFYADIDMEMDFFTVDIATAGFKVSCKMYLVENWLLTHGPQLGRLKVILN